MQQEIPSRSSSQIRTHAQKFFIRLRNKLGCTEEQALQFLKTRPAKYFVSDSHKYAKLEVEQVFPHIVKDENTPMNGQTQFASIFAPKILVPTPIRADILIKPKSFTQLHPIQTPPPENISKETPSVKLEYSPRVVSTSHSLSPSFDSQDISKDSKSFHTNNRQSQNSMGGIKEQLDPKFSNQFSMPNFVSSISTIVQDNVLLNESIKNSFSRLSSFTRKLETENQPQMKIENFKSFASEIEGILKGMANSITKSNALIQQIVIQSILWNGKNSQTSSLP